jgi:hypothetical protein
MKLTKTEAKIIVLLNNLSNENKTYYFLAAKLDISYDYLIHKVGIMVVKNWIKIEHYRSKVGRKAYFILTETAPLAEAVKLLTDIDTTK